MSESTVFTSSINRLYKLQDRLKQVINAAGERFAQGTSVVLRNPLPSQVNRERFAEMAEQGIQAFEEYKQASGVLLKIRKAVSRASGPVNELMTELEAVKAREGFLSGRLQPLQDISVIPFEDLEDYAQGLTKSQGTESANNPYVSSMGVRIALLSRESQALLKAELEQLRLRSFALQEQVAEANQTRVNVEVTETELKLLHRLIGQG